MTASNNKRIAKNTSMLYFRMLLTMVVALYTVRVVLKTLGVVDYGIYNVVGGVVSAFSFISGTMASASERFFAFEIGRNDFVRLKNVFSVSVTIYIIITLLFILVAETLGLWFLNTRLTIPPDRIEAANWIYQFSILAFGTTLITIPYNASIIAHEEMSIYAYVSILEVILKLIIVYFLVIFEADKLKLYAVLTFAVTLIITFVYRTYCKKKFKECRFSFFWDKALFKTLLSYSGWNLFGTLTSVTFNQGITFLINIFFGPVVNAASAIAYQVNTSIASFSSNFYTAVRPQIVKSYAEDNKSYVIDLVFNSTKFSFFLLLFISMPILIETKFILAIWLKEPPILASMFVKLIILFSFVNLLQIPITTAVQATGVIRKYQIIVGAIMLFCLPIFYVCIKLGLKPESAYYSMIFVSIIAVIFRLRILHDLINFSYKRYINHVLLKLFLVSVCSYILPFIITRNMNDGWLRFIVTGLAGALSTMACVYFIGLGGDERKFVLSFIKKRIEKLRFSKADIQ